MRKVEVFVNEILKHQFVVAKSEIQKRIHSILKLYPKKKYTIYYDIKHLD